MKRFITLGSSAIALGLGLLAGGPAFAQSTAPSEATDPAGARAGKGNEDTEIVVTGTSIRGVPPVGSDLVQLGRVEIESSTATDVAAIIREVPQVLNFGVTDASRRQSGGSGNVVSANSINIRGIGPYSTLSLINGRRPVGQGTFGASVDPNTVPAIALERVEIIADGASAVYGSDAVAGVANLIIRRRYDGVGIETNYGFGDEYRNFVASAIVGADWGSGHFTLSGQHAYRTAVGGFDRDYNQADLRAFGGLDYRVLQCSPGNIVAGGVTYAIPASGVTPASLAANAGKSNLCDNRRASDLLPQQEINSGFLTFDQDLTDNIKFFADAFYARRDGLRRGVVAAQNLTVPQTNAFFVAPAGAVLSACPTSAGAPSGTLCETVQHSFSGSYGAYSKDDIRSTLWQATAGFDIAFGKDFNLNLYGSYGRSHDHVTSVGTNTDAANLAAALVSSNPATAYNPFGTSANNQSVIDAIFNNITDYDGKSRQFDGGFRLDGPIVSLPGGDLKIAVGGEYFHTSLVTGRLVGRKGAQTGAPDTYSRNVQSLYGELFVPVVGEQNAMPGIRSFDVSIAARYDKYSDVGSTTNPKIGINWRPVEDLKIRGSYGTSFRAPLISSLLSPNSAFNALFITPLFDPTVNATVTGVTYFGANSAIKPETARTYSLGFEYSPSWRNGLKLSVNYFDIVYKDQIAMYFGNPNVLRQEALYSSIILRDAAAQARIAQLINSGLRVFGSTADALASPVLVDGRSINLGTTITRGIDFGLAVPWTIASLGNFRFNLNGTRFFTYKVRFTPTGLLTEQLNNIDNPLKLRMRGALGWDKGPARATVYVNYQSGYNNTFSTLVPKVSSYTTVDLSLAYKLDTIMPLVKEAEIGLNVTNLFDRDPPFVDIAGGFDPVNASPVGRVVAASLRARF